jgi:hypothetical protein
VRGRMGNGQPRDPSSHEHTPLSVSVGQ